MSGVLYKALFATILGLALISGSAHAATLSIDFGAAGVETGFVGQSSTNVTHMTASGDINVALSGGSAFNHTTTTATSNKDLWQDFYYSNSGSMTLTVSGAGIEANTSYDLGFWAFYSGDGGGRDVVISAASGSGTSGPTLDEIASNASPAPTSLTDPLYYTSGTYTSNGSGVLTITIGSNRNRPALNAFELTAVPEPSAPILCVLASLLLLRRKRH